MRFEPTFEQASIAEVIQSIVADWKPQNVEEANTSLAIKTQALSDGGWSGLGIPEEYGGIGLGLYEATLVTEELSASLLPAPFRSTVSTARSLLAGLTHSASKDAHKVCSEILPKLASGENSTVGLLLENQPNIVADVDNCNHMLLFRNQLGFIGTPNDFEIEDTRTLDTTRTYARVSCDDEKSPILDQKATAWALAEVRTLLSAELIGVARMALGQAVAFAQDREAFGKKIGSFQAVGHRLADSARYLDGARIMCHSAAWHADTQSEELLRYSRIALLSAQRAVIHSTGTAIQTHGAYGFTWESGLHWYQRRGHIASNLLGDTKLLRRELANELAQFPPN